MGKVFREMLAELHTPQWWVRLGLMFGFLMGFVALGLPRLYAAAASVLVAVVLSQVGPLKSPRKK